MRVIVWLLFGLCAAAQTPGDPCLIQGSVINAVTNMPVRKAQLMLRPAKGGQPLRAATDADGKYVIANVPPGAWRRSGVEHKDRFFLDSVRLDRGPRRR
ncbi:MAG TPA: carboxypeptidase-like regulatory domain-containing protein [Bryobacteraceae bacterium]|nr:carboxypeptidase-like regulatory domain-containing protein [Bryobacteraceae bacterium]